MTQQTEWQPIKTAPKGGPAILGLLVVEDMHHHVIVRWGDGAWLDEYDNEHRPDYWQPLPEPPADGETAKHGPFSAAAAEELYNRIDGEIGDRSAD